MHKVQQIGFDMSAVAISISADGRQVVLASDGMTTQNGRIHDLNTSKILKVSDHIAIQWMGCGQGPCGDSVVHRAQGVNTVKAVAEIVADELKKVYDNPQNRHILDSHPFWVMVVGYDSAGFQAWRVWSEEPSGRYSLVPENLPPGTIGAKTATRGPEATSFQALLATKYWPLYAPDLHHAVKGAFIEMVEDYNSQGELCGGKIFTEVLKL